MFAGEMLEDGGFETDFTSARIGIETTVQYMDVTEMEYTYTLRHTLIDAEGKAVKSCEVKGMPLDGKQSHTTSAWMTVSDPHLWDCDDPYLYTLVTEVYTNGILEDVCKTVTGIRHIEFDPDKGFLLNGNQVKLKGVNMHQDHAGVGSGIPDGLQEWRLLQLKKFGCNAYRSSHNPMTPELLDACDRLGILVIEENRLTGINKEHNNIIEYSLKLDSNPEFTTSVLLAYARAAYRLYKDGAYGAKTVFDIPPAYLSPKSGAELRKELL
jgi:beta-galactosidase